MGLITDWATAWQIRPKGVIHVGAGLAEEVNEYAAITKRVRILEGDVREQLKTLPDGSVHCCVTSPPYWGLRDYGVPGQLGSEKTPAEYVAVMVAVFREVRRVLRDDGTLWLNMGDTYATFKGSCHNPGGGENSLGKHLKAAGVIPTGRASANRMLTPGTEGLKPKDLIGIPWRLAFALRADGWWLRQDIIWQKPNPMPESVTDRCTKAHEYVFLLTKSAHYFYDAEAVKEPQTGTAHSRGQGTAQKEEVPGRGTKSNTSFNRVMTAYTEVPGGRNKRSVWTIPTQAYHGAHFATFPEALVEPCILAGTSTKGCCPKCGAPWERMVNKVTNTEGRKLAGKHEGEYQRGRVTPRTAEAGDFHDLGTVSVRTVGWQPTCGCKEAVFPGLCTVLDPFLGSGTTAVVAARHGRNCIGIELNPAYMKLAQRRLNESVGLLLQEMA